MSEGPQARKYPRVGLGGDSAIIGGYGYGFFCRHFRARHWASAI